MLSDEYCAGFFDADGFVSVIYQPKHRQWYAPLLAITQKHAEILELFCEEWGGTITYGKYVTWRLTGSAIPPFATAILPHLTLKKRRVEIAMELFNLTTGMRGTYMTEEMLLQRKMLVDEMRIMQDKGRRTYTDAVRVADAPATIKQ